MSESSVFITGASGFIGRHLLGQLGDGRSGPVTCLSRAEPAASVPAPFEWVRGDITEPRTYSSRLGPATTVLHLAASTGKATAAEHERVNVLGTQAVVSACVERGVRRLVFVSTIAARYADLRAYPYARSKLAAEGIVRRSGLPWFIVRPTVVLGRGSPIQQRLRQLARRSIVPLIGDGRARLQPIHVRDVATVLGSLLHDDSAAGVLELGGPEALSMSDLLARIYHLDHDRAPRFLRLPYRPLAWALAAAEPWAYRFLPITAGQLAVFVNDSTVEADDRLRSLWPGMMRVADILADLQAEKS